VQSDTANGAAPLSSQRVEIRRRKIDKTNEQKQQRCQAEEFLQDVAHHLFPLSSLVGLFEMDLFTSSELFSLKTNHGLKTNDPGSFQLGLSGFHLGSLRY
jgi:hypothetical protein